MCEGIGSVCPTPAPLRGRDHPGDPPWDVPSLLEASPGDSVELTQRSFLSILGCCPRGAVVTGTCGTPGSATSSALSRLQLCLGTNSPSKVSLGNLQTQIQGALGLPLLFIVRQPTGTGPPRAPGSAQTQTPAAEPRSALPEFSAFIQS